ncbi:MAG: TonB-dependent receptor [Pseudomonadota bacterium]
MGCSKFRSIAHKSSLAIAVAVALGANSAYAQDSESVEDIPEIIVVGQTAQIRKALNEQKNADDIRSVVHADGIAQLPDDNAAEALQRISGVAIQRDQGEGRFVTVRGLAPELNNVVINGTTVPAPEDGTRAVALDVLPSELVQSLAVVKTLTPDMDASSLGGSVEVRSLSAFDRDGLFYTISAEASYDSNVEETSPKLSGGISNIFSIGNGSKNLGIAAALSWDDRDFGSDNVETGGAWDFDDNGAASLEETELRDYEINRTRIGAGINIDFRPDDRTNYYLRTLYSNFEDTETRLAAGVEFEDPVAIGATGSAEGFREYRNRTETQEIMSYVVGFDKTLDFWTINGRAGYSKASEDTPFHVGGAVYEGNNNFENTGFVSAERPTVTAGAEFFAPESFTLAEIEWDRQLTEDEITSLQVDLARAHDLFGESSEFKFGVKYSQRTKDNEAEVFVFEDLEDQGLNAADLSLTGAALNPVDYPIGAFGPAISGAQARNVINSLSLADNFDLEESEINDFEINEDIVSAYVMNTWDVNKWRFIAGVRYEGTDFESIGTGLLDDAFVDSVTSNDYSNVLPGFHARYAFSDNTFARFAWTNSVVRPTFEAVAPGFVFDGDEASFGNPELDPLESTNFDIGIEHYIGTAGVLSAFAFYKDIDNFVYQTDLAGTGAFSDFSEAETFANGETAEVYGLELAYSQRFENLPAPWSGLLVASNLTLSTSEAEIAGLGRTRSIDLPGQAPTVANLSLGWENERLFVRVSANYTDEYLQEVSDIDAPELDLYLDSQLFVDFRISYFVTERAQITFEAKNLTDEAFYVYTNRTALNAQYEEYGPAFRLSFTLSEF